MIHHYGRMTRMSRTIILQRMCCLLAGLMVFLITAASGAEVEAIKGKNYKLTKKHGPWMIMVASLRDVDEERRIKGMTAAQAADELVYELRKKKGIPAYSYPLGDSITVFAGNYPSINDDRLQKDLKTIKEKFEPAFLTEEKNGGIFFRSPGRPGPLSKAWASTNPLLSPEEVKQKTVDREEMKLIATLNADMDHSLLKNKGKYTLVIATFAGNAIMQVGNKADSRAMERFEKSFGNNLDQTGMEAWALTEALRSAKKSGYDQNYEAWVFHDRHRSVVTIGSFDDQNDPRIQTLATQFRAKPGRHPQTGEEMMTPELFSIPKNPVGGKPADRMWIFDGNPKLIEVPRVK